jgi:uncharacterized membrane protein YbhN (UPF0104 family)
MSWLEVASIALVCLGLVAGAFLFARRPEFWIEFGYRLFERLWPLVWKFISTPEPDEVRKARQRCERMGGKWDWHRKKCDR